jgi:dolichyl-phosphate-mannose-protein mannosyltransferase
MSSEKSHRNPQHLHVQTGTGAFLGFWKPGVSILTSPPSFQPVVETDDLYALGAVIVMAAGLRFYRLNYPANAVSEEVSIGGMINRYLKGTFFINIEPPLVAMLYYYIAKLTGYNGSFVFEDLGQPYASRIFPYTALRGLNGILGTTSVILAYLTLKHCGVSRRSAFLGSTFVAIENSFVTQNRFILSQPILQFATVSSIYLWKRFQNTQNLTAKWFSLALLLSISLGMASSAGSAGVYTVLFVVLVSLYQLWWICGDPQIKIPRIITSLLVRLVVLTIFPLIIYILSCTMHLLLTPRSGDGDPYMSGAFQSYLIGNDLPSVPPNVTLGSFVTIRNMAVNGYLHSHNHFYPSGSYQQQVNLYGYRDINNVWMIELSTPADQQQNNNTILQPIFGEEFIRLLHVGTNRRLHSHNHKSPSDNDWEYEVSAYGADNYPGDLNDIWKLEIVTDLSEPGDSQIKWQTIKSVVRLRHMVSGCYLFVHRRKLPSWGFEQYEVTCAVQGIVKNSLWFVESNFHPKYNITANYVTYREPNMADKLLEYMETMAITKQDLEPEIQFQQPAWRLPFLPGAVQYVVLNGTQILLFGNVTIWYLSILAIVIYGLLKVVSLVALQRGFEFDQFRSALIRVDHEMGHLILAWAIHYLPAVLKINADISDYLPALYCSILAFTVLWDFVFTFIVRQWWIQHVTFSLVLFSASYSFFAYSPLVFGTEWDTDICESRQFFDWRFNCNLYSTGAYDVHNTLGVRSIIPDNTDSNEEPLILDYNEPGVYDALLRHLKARNFDQFPIIRKLYFNEKDQVESENQSKADHNEEFDSETETDQCRESEGKVDIKSSWEGKDHVSVDPKIEMAIKTQWARITPPPSLGNRTKDTTEEDSRQEDKQSSADDNNAPENNDEKSGSAGSALNE